MNRYRISLSFILALLTSGVPLAQNHEVVRQSVDSGAPGVHGARFSLSGSVGQPDASEPTATQPYQHTGGFWRLSAHNKGSDVLFEDGFESGRSLVGNSGEIDKY